MNFILFLMSIFPGLSAHAAECPRQIGCGVFEGAGAWYDVQGNPEKNREYKERLEFQAIDSTRVRVKVFIYSGEEPGEPWANATMALKADGRVSITTGGETLAVGFCANKSCNLAFRPVHVADGRQDFMNVFANIIRFDGKTLKRFNMVSNSSNEADLLFQRSTLTQR